MSRVELFERLSNKQPRLSIADEIKRQNLILEERNSQIKQSEELSSINKCNHEEEKKVIDSMRYGISISDKGNVCGSPAYKLTQEQLMIANSKEISWRGAKRLGSGPRILQDAGGKSSLDSPRSGAADSQLLSIRPLSDYTARETQGTLIVTGGACTVKPGVQTSSAKISLQDSNNTRDNDAVDNRNQNIGSQKVRVSLTFLKEKSRPTTGIIRHKFDGCLPETSVLDSGGPTFCVRNIKANMHEREIHGQKTPRDAVIVESRESPRHSSAPDCSHSKSTMNCDKPKLDSRDVNSNAHDNQEKSSSASSSSTPTAAFSGSELLYGPDGMSRQPQADDLAGSDISGYERDKQRLRDLDAGNKRPQSKNKRSSYSIADKVTFDREREDGRVLDNSLPAKPPTLRGNGMRSNLVRGEQLLTQRTLGSSTGREPDDLIAMGTLWSPANNNATQNSNNNTNNTSGGSSSGLATRSSSTTTPSNKSVPFVSQNNGSSHNNNSNNSQRKPISVSMNTSGRLSHSSSFNGIPNNTFGRQLSNSHKEEPKYPDPLSGAPASFQQRLMELASLEAETIRWERTKKVKKKPRQDRDS